MADCTWFVDALKDISEFAKEEKIDGVMEGLAVALETYAIEAGVSVDQHNEILSLLRVNRTPPAQAREFGPQKVADISYLERDMPHERTSAAEKKPRD